MLHSDWFSLIALVSMKVSFSDMMQGDNGNIKVLLGITSFTSYLVIYVICRCIVLFCLYSEMALYNISEWVLLWAQQVEAQRMENEALINIREAKDFDSSNFKQLSVFI